MSLTNLEKTPWPWFGGKADAAPIVWEALGDVAHYSEPFAGSLAVLLRRPHPCNRTYYSETVNDMDGLLCNAWRSMQMAPDAMADAASWPVCEADVHARHLALLRWRESRSLERLMADPLYHDPVMAGWWAWGQSCWIGSGWCSGSGPWIVGDDGTIRRRPKAQKRPGVSRKRPHIADDGRGVNRPQAREPGVWRQLPHIADNGRGVNRPQAREPGVSRQLPHIADNGRGVNHAGTREPGVSRKLPHIADDGMGVNRPQAREPGVGDYHPMTMPELRRWFRFLSARLRHVRVLNGDWKRACTSGAVLTLPVRSGKGPAGVFLDPPYLVDNNRRADLYTHDNGDTVAMDVQRWCVEWGTRENVRIVLAGYEGEHNILHERHGWRCVPWYKSGFLKGGMGNVAGSGGGQQTRERLWMSPACVVPQSERRQVALFGGGR